MSDDPITFLASTSKAREDSARGHLWPLIIIVLALMAVAVHFFGTAPPETGSSPTASQEPDRQVRIYTISYRFGVFSPTNLRIHVGDTVRFRNDSSSPIRIVSELQPGQKTPEFDSVGQLQPDSYFSYTFATAGTFGYYNNDNGSESGVIIVR